MAVVLIWAGVIAGLAFVIGRLRSFSPK